MLHHVRKFHDLGELHARLRDAEAADAALIDEVIGAACRRYPSLGQTEKTARLTQLIQSGAWTDAALALIVFCATIFYGIRTRGLFGYLATFADPTWIMIPLNVVEGITRTFSLMVRLFGNIMSGVFIIGIPAPDDPNPRFYDLQVWVPLSLIDRIDLLPETAAPVVP